MTAAIAKHTPGPWTFLTDSFSGDNAITAEGAGVFVEAFADIRRAGEGARDEAKANAALIAAAPDMLVALKAVADATAGTGPLDTDRVAKMNLAFRAARAAVAKAEASQE